VADQVVANHAVAAGFVVAVVAAASAGEGRRLCPFQEVAITELRHANRRRI
jgi:hypothetical protein